MHSAEIMLVIGTRPEAIKLAPVANALAAHGLKPVLIVTGQHAGLDLAEYGLASYPAVQLNCPGLEDPHRHVRNVTAAALMQLGKPPTLLVVQGDTSSALGGALAGFTARVPVAHVEAGLRSGDPRMPWPEEEYRRAIDAHADLLFAPTYAAAENLRLEQVAGAIHVTGNSGIDALLQLQVQLPPKAPSGARPRVLVGCHRRENWGEGVRSVTAAVKRLARDRLARFDVLLHPNAELSAAVRDHLHGVAGVQLVEPCSHRDMILRMRECDLILSDSGGIQEEAPALGVPLFVLREKTERPEGVSSGNSRLVGTDCNAIVGAVAGFFGDRRARAAMSKRALPFGDGNASPRIAGIIAEWLARREPRRLRSA